MNIQIDSLMFEITRFCNMQCLHCIRGDVQRKRIQKQTITKTLMQLDYVPTIMFTGGEPALALDLIRFTLDECKRMGINVGNFWMATNGTVHSEKFFNLIRDWLYYCDDNEVSGIRVSVDRYHYNYVDLTPFNRFEEELQYKGVECTFEYGGAPNDSQYLISDGRAVFNYPATKQVDHHITLGEDERLEGTTYINIYGDVISTCDISYDTQDMYASEYNLGNIHKENLDEIYERFFEENPSRRN